MKNGTWSSCEAQSDLIKKQSERLKAVGYWKLKLRGKLWVVAICRRHLEGGRKHGNRGDSLENVVFVSIAFLLITDTVTNLVTRGRDSLMIMVSKEEGGVKCRGNI